MKLLLKAEYAAVSLAPGDEGEDFKASSIASWSKRLPRVGWCTCEKALP